jgi:hypothetical protein
VSIENIAVNVTGGVRKSLIWRKPEAVNRSGA